MKIGYARVSTPDQSLDLQVDALQEAGCEEIYKEIASGAKTDRPELDKLLDYIRGGDTVFIWKLDRLGRSMSHLLQIVEQLEKKGAGFVCINEKIDTTSPAGKLIFHLFGALAEFEREMIRERTQAGLKAARARGRVGGRPKKITEKKAKALQVLYEAQELSVGDICKQFGISKGTFYRYVKK